MVDLAPDAVADIYAFAGLEMFTEGVFESPVDVIDRKGLKAYVRPNMTEDALYAFWTIRERSARFPRPSSRRGR